MPVEQWVDDLRASTAAPRGKPPLTPRQRQVTIVTDPVTDNLRAEKNALQDEVRQLRDQLTAHRQLSKALCSRDEAKNYLITTLQEKITELEKALVRLQKPTPMPPPKRMNIGFFIPKPPSMRKPEYTRKASDESLTA